MCCTRAVFLNHSPSQPNQRSSEPHFQTTFSHFAKQEFPPPSPQTSPEPVNFPCFNNFFGSKPCPVSIYPAYFRPSSPNADCCIFSRARFATSKKLPLGVIGRRCAVLNTYSALKSKR